MNSTCHNIDQGSEILFSDIKGLAAHNRCKFLDCANGHIVGANFFEILFPNTHDVNAHSRCKFFGF
jgi:hypothetical protein